MLGDAIRGVAGDVPVVHIPISDLPEKIVGIYFLLRGGVCVYVGQSVDVLTRIHNHVGDATFGVLGNEPKLFDSVSYFRCSCEDLDRLEARFIASLKPEYNVNPGSTRGKAERGSGPEPMTAAVEHDRKIAEARDVAFGFLSHTDEECVNAKDLQRRVYDRVRLSVGVTRFVRIIRDDPRFRYDDATQSFRLAARDVVTHV